jgi:hypothetical protein
MRFRCRHPLWDFFDMLETAITKKNKRQMDLGKHEWFAWRPVKLPDGYCHWMVKVERSRQCWFTQVQRADNHNQMLITTDAYWRYYPL